MEKQIIFDLLNVTEKAALAAYNFIGKGDKEGGDKAAVDAMRHALNKMDFLGKVVIGEGEKDDAPMLYNGEIVGKDVEMGYDLAIDPVEGTNLMAWDRPNAITVLGLSEKDSLWDPGPSFYMDKLVVNQKAKDCIDINQTPQYNLKKIAKALDKNINDLTVFVLDKPRHEDLVKAIRSTGARVTLQTDGDVLGALAAAMPASKIDVLMGIGGTPEGVIAACAVKALNGGMQGKRAPQLPSEKAQLDKLNLSTEEILNLDTLVRSNKNLFVATGITTGHLINGVHKDLYTNQFITESLIIDGQTNQTRIIKTFHPQN